MRCPWCEEAESRVLDSRPTEDGGVIRRRRECTHCDRRFTTYERVEARPLVVVKKDGRREVFSQAKILSGLLKACEKRPVSLDRLERTVADIERELRQESEGEVTTEDVGEKVMDKLRDLDEVAYVRFASVYRQFTDVRRFMDELDKLVSRRGEGRDAGDGTEV
ncbi:MAG: transcriptional regulator NrdR [Bacillota bacterium]